jgi:UDP-glucose 4-epimerase
MHVLVTGGAGFIGSHIVEHHLKCGDIIHVLDDLSTGSLSNIKAFQSHPNVHFTEANLLTYPEIGKIVSWADRIYHLAAVVGVFRVLEAPEKVLSVNIGATERLLRAARESTWKPRIIIASTSEVYDENSNQTLSEDSDLIIANHLRSRATYAISKIAAESFALSYHQRFNIPVTVLRFFNTIGPRQTGEYGMVVPRFIKSALQNEPIIVYGTGEQVRSFVDVRDSVSMITEIADSTALAGKTLNVGDDHSITINQLAILIKQLAESKSEIKHISYLEAYKEEFKDCMFRKPDLTRLHKHIKYTNQWNLEKTLLDIIALSRGY